MDASLRLGVKSREKLKLTQFLPPVPKSNDRMPWSGPLTSDGCVNKLIRLCREGGCPIDTEEAEREIIKSNMNARAAYAAVLTRHKTKKAVVDECESKGFQVPTASVARSYELFGRDVKRSTEFLQRVHQKKRELYNLLKDIGTKFPDEKVEYLALHYSSVPALILKDFNIKIVPHS